MKESPDWDALIQQHLDGQTTEQEAAVLSEQIIADADVRSRYLKAAQVHGALADEMLALELEMGPNQAEASMRKSAAVRHIGWPQQLAAALVAGALVGLLGVGVVWAVNSPRAVVSSLRIADGQFDSLPVGPIKRGFSSRFGEWSGDPVEVVEEADGNRRLRFMETGNVKGDPQGGASACNAFQFVDLTALRHQWQDNDRDAQQTLELSVNFKRKPSSIDDEYPRLRADCRIYLFDTTPEAIIDGWPHVLSDVIAVGKKTVRLEPGEVSGKIVASCLLEPEATIALITLGVGVGMQTNTPIELGNYYADDVELTLTSSPKLPVRFVK